MKLTEDQQEKIFSKIEKVTNQMTDVYMQNVSADLKVLTEKKH